MANQKYKTPTYVISGNSSLLDEINHITPEVGRILLELKPDIENGRKYLLKKINKLCLQYPRVPVFKNILSNLYEQQGNMKQAIAVNHWLVKEHPHYLFGKVNLAAEYLSREEPHKVPEILGEYLEIGTLYPERKEFHVEEVLAFNLIVIHYFLAIGEIDDAELRVELLQDLDEDHPKTRQALDAIQRWYLLNAAVRTEGRKETERKVPVKDTRSHLQTEEAPQFNFPEQIGWLYEKGLKIDFFEIEKILQLEPQKLVEDLEKMLQDSIARFDYFMEAALKENVELQELDFPQHALLLLGHLKSERSFDQILLVLQQDKEFTDFWFGYNLSYLLENAIFHCGRNKIPELFKFLKQPNICGQSKAVVGETLVKMIGEQGDNDKYIPKYKELLDHYIANADDENLADTEAIGFLISDVVDLGYNSLLPEIKQLFELDLVDSFICGAYERLEPEMRKFSYMPYEGFAKQELNQQYQFFNEEDSHLFPIETSDFDEMYYRQSLEAIEEMNKPLRSEKKIGRNDPCPCGSGKKYKKCCLND
ncbi:SEC-C metal-binding domain-containing protein [Salinimicrobium xinjiangense]|uniref:SEC-C metal-binding domain-containing protein n=1 Tax=Salinimicrobium xinjiangense TaxID=438596 RepID=UPI0004147894|nr:SEC-C metal-binding domain-containing protein [Salinimicrobium xinjiangense]